MDTPLLFFCSFQVNQSDCVECPLATEGWGYHADWGGAVYQRVECSGQLHLCHLHRRKAEVAMGFALAAGGPGCCCLFAPGPLVALFDACHLCMTPRVVFSLVLMYKWGLK